VLADPFAVSLHAVLRAPPEPGETVLVWGCGSLGLMAIHLLRVLFPKTTILAVDHKPRMKDMVERLGATRLFTSRGKDLIAEIGDYVKAPMRAPYFGLPWLQTGIDKIYDTVGAPTTLEIGLRVVRPRATIVMVGVAEPKRFEWTPLYFKEIELCGSNAFGVEEHRGRRQHAIQWYLEFAASGRIDATPILTHRFPLDAWREAFLTCFDQSRSGAVKVLFDLAV